MMVCDPCWNRKRETTQAVDTVTIDHAVYHLCAEHRAEAIELLSRQDKRRSKGQGPKTR